MNWKMIRAARHHFFGRLRYRGAAARRVIGEDDKTPIPRQCELSPGHPKAHALPPFGDCWIVPLGRRLFDVRRDEDSSSAAVDWGWPRA